MQAFWASNTYLRSSYSQAGEDTIIWKGIRSIDPKGMGYVDVGAYHPTFISNTYLLYRKGWQGVVVEPNIESCMLFRRYRPKDVVMNAGVGSAPGVMHYVRKVSPSSNYLMPHSADYDSAELVSISTVDDLVWAMDYKYIVLMSIDTEGMEKEVLIGAKETLKRTLYLCIETNNNKAYEMELLKLVPSEYEIVGRTIYNTILLNKEVEAVL